MFFVAPYEAGFAVRQLQGDGVPDRVVSTHCTVEDAQAEAETLNLSQGSDYSHIENPADFEQMLIDLMDPDTPAG